MLNCVCDTCTHRQKKISSRTVKIWLNSSICWSNNLKPANLKRCQLAPLPITLRLKMPNIDNSLKIHWPICWWHFALTIPTIWWHSVKFRSVLANRNSMCPSFVLHSRIVSIMCLANVLRRTETHYDWSTWLLLKIPWPWTVWSISVISKQFCSRNHSSMRRISPPRKKTFHEICSKSFWLNRTVNSFRHQHIDRMQNTQDHRVIWESMRRIESGKRSLSNSNKFIVQLIISSLFDCFDT